MKRGIGAAVLALALTWGLAPDGRAAPGDVVRGPACADLTVANVGVTHDAGLPVLGAPANQVQADLQLAAPSCVDATYTLSVVADDYTCDETGTQCAPNPGAAPADAVRTGDGTTASFDDVTVTVADDDGSVCVMGHSAVRGRVADLAPDDGCRVFVAGTSPGIGMR